MIVNKLYRLFLLPFGLLIRLYYLAVDGSRDIYNKLHFKGATIDNNCCINDSSTISPNTHILENCLILNGDIKPYSYIGRNSIIQNATIGSFCSIANDVFVGLGTHPTNLFSTSPLFYRRNNTFDIKLVSENLDFSEYSSIEIGNDVWIGSRATIIDGVKVGDGAIIAAGTLVTKDVEPYSIIGGVPAKIIKYRFSQETIEKLIKLQWWSWSLNEIQARMTELNKLVD